MSCFSSNVLAERNRQRPWHPKEEIVEVRRIPVFIGWFLLCTPVRAHCVPLGCRCTSSSHAAPVITESQARRLNALMLTCGTYDAAGEFAYRIGLPCKSGVGGIVAVVPDQLTLCVWSPALDASGNSLLGMHALELFAGRTGLSIF